MGVYLVPFDLTMLDEMGDGAGQAAVNKVLGQAGLPDLHSSTGEGEGFEEMLIADMTSYTRLVEGLAPRLGDNRPPLPQGAVPQSFPAGVADLWLPIEFSGLLVVPAVSGIYQDQLTIASSIDILGQQEAIASSIGFPLDSVPQLDPSGYIINHWHEEQQPSVDPADPVWRRDPDIAFYLALFWSVAKYSVVHQAAVSYT
jgi:hypothetical protein